MRLRELPLLDPPVARETQDRRRQALYPGVIALLSVTKSGAEMADPVIY